MTTSYSVIPAQESDVAEIVRLSLELGYPTTVEQTRKTLKVMLSSPNYLAIVASTQAEQLIGWAVAERRISLESGESVELTGLIVSHAARLTGVGRALVSATENWAIQNGFSAIRVRSNIARSESHPFYERLGFERAKTQHVYKKPLVPTISSHGLAALRE